MGRAILALAVSGALIAAEQTPPGTGVIAGRVLDAATGRQVVSATVTVLTEHERSIEIPVVPSGNVIVSDAGSRVAQVLTESDGGFVVRNLPSGALLVQTRKLGWVEMTYGQRRPSDPPRLVHLKQAEQRTDLTLHVWRESLISGRVVDQRDQPIPNFHIRALSPTYRAGRRFWGGYLGATTDDRGEYEIAVPPGQFVLIAFPNSANSVSHLGPLREGRRWTFRPTIYPDATTMNQATPIVVGAAEERSGIDFHLSSVPSTHVSGSVLGPHGAVGRASVRAVRRGLEDLDAHSMLPIDLIAEADMDGRFTFASLPEGQYTLRALSLPEMPWMTHGIAPLRALPAGATLAAELPVDAEGPRVELALTAAEGARLRGEPHPASGVNR